VTDRALTSATAQQLAAARARSGALGLYFRLADPTAGAEGVVHEPDPAAEPGKPVFAAAGHGSWQPVAGLYERGQGQLDELLDSVPARLGGCERRVAASLFFQGYAARLLSPQLGCLAVGGCLPSVPADQLTWRQPASEMIQLGLPPGAGWQGPAEPLLDQLLVQTFTVHLWPLAIAIRSRTRISADLLQDNAASALVNGLRLLDQQLDGGWRPLATRALADPLLDGSGLLTEGDPGFVRRSCCLYYRTPGGGLCGDCPLV
jgi:iron complex transport system ATP-binding protein